MSGVPSPRRSRAVVCALLALALAGCNEAQPKKKTYVEVEKKPELVPGAKPGDQNVQGKPGGATGAAPAYLPPSARGARVEMTEAPEGSPPPQSTPANTSRRETVGGTKTPDGGAPGGARAKGAGDEGGNMPTTAGAPTYQPPPGMQQPDAPANASLGRAAPVPPPAPDSKYPPIDFKPPPGGAAAEMQKLDAKKRDFDAEMRRAQDEEARTGAPSAGPAAAEIDRGGVPGRNTGKGRVPGKHAGDRTSDDAKALATEGDPTAPGGTALEDIVAAQMRHAAENERDPVLREKLWAEYRRYVSGTGAKK